MAMYPNGRYLTISPGRHFGPNAGLEVYARARGDRLNRFVSESYARTASTPDGYDVHGLVPAITAGSMSARRPIADTTGAANLLSGGPMEGTAAMLTLTQTGGLSLVVGLEGNAVVATLSGDGMVLSLTIGLDGTASMTLSGAAGLSMIVPFEGSGTVASLAGSADLRGDMSMSGEWTPFTELSPENLAREVWSAAAASYNDAGTMGAKLNSAASGGVDYEALGLAVWASVSRTLTAGGAAPTTAEITDAVLAALNATAIPVDVQKVKGQTIAGSGSEGDPWGPV